MHNINQVKRRLKLSGSGMPLSAGEIRMLLINLIDEVERLSNEISVHRPEVDRESRETVSPSRPKLRGRKQSQPTDTSSAQSGSTRVDT